MAKPLSRLPEYETAGPSHERKTSVVDSTSKEILQESEDESQRLLNRKTAQANTKLLDAVSNGDLDECTR